MVSGADAIAMGLASHYVDSAALPALVAELAGRTASSAVARFGQAAPESELAKARWWIDEAYAPDRVESILERLARVGDPDADAAAQTLAAKSPTSVTVTLAALRRARALGSLEETLNQELRVSLRALRWPDFAEGIRAQLVDKDRNPQWQPASLAAVSQDVVSGAFADLGGRELGLHEPVDEVVSG
jgi:enoyl-CoA hydratase